MELTTRFFHPPSQSFFLVGPRGTGKSTWLHHLFPRALFLDLLDTELCRTLAARPEQLNTLIQGNPTKHPVIIDEIQRVPEVLSIVHQLIERDRALRFVLTGSSARKLKRAGVDLLAGRALLRTMHPFMATELGSAFQLEAALQFGLLPLVVASPHPEDLLRSYASLYLKEEVRMEGLVRRIGDFARCLEALSFSHGAVLNTAHVARDCEVKRKTVESYLDVAEDLLLTFRLPVFTKRAKRHLIHHPKFYYFDAGVFRSLRPRGPLDAPGELGGAALEGLVAQHLRAWNAYSGDRHQLSFWRTKAGLEVDLVLYGPETFLAIEVKPTRTIHPEDLRGLRAFHEDYPAATLLYLYRGRERLKVKQVLCLPCEEFLARLVPGHDILTRLRG